jgi:hypothetical protein
MISLKLHRLKALAPPPPHWGRGDVSDYCIYTYVLYCILLYSRQRFVRYNIFYR